MKHQKVTDCLGKPSRGRQEILPPCAPDLYSLHPKMQTGMRYLTTITVSSLTALGGEDADHVTATASPGSSFPLSPIGQVPCPLPLTERMCNDGNLFLPPKYTFKYATWGFIVQAWSVKEELD